MKHSRPTSYQYQSQLLQKWCDVVNRPSLQSQIITWEHHIPRSHIEIYDYANQYCAMQGIAVSLIYVKSQPRMLRQQISCMLNLNLPSWLDKCFNLFAVFHGCDVCSRCTDFSRTPVRRLSNWFLSSKLKRNQLGVQRSMQQELKAVASCNSVTKDTESMHRHISSMTHTTYPVELSLICRSCTSTYP